MFIKRNQLVRLRHTDDLAYFIQELDSTFSEVELAKDESIIVVETKDILSTKLNQKSEVSKAKNQSFDAFDTGIKMMFIPQNLDGQEEHIYELYCSNGTNSSWLLDIKISDPNKTHLKRLIAVAPQKIYFLDEFRRDLINNKPKMTLNFREKLTNGTGRNTTFNISLKAKNFFSKRQPLFDERYSYVFRMEKKNQHQDRNSISLPIQPREKTDYEAQLLDISTFFDTSREIDLHIEELIEDSFGMSNAEIIRLQMEHFEKYLDRAIAAKLDRAFIIHGLGKGVLKNKIHQVLIQNEHIQRFVNEYHPRYGWGATEIIFK
jgi:hypothetical protein